MVTDQARGLRLAGDIITGMITKEVPIDTGILRRSAFTQRGKRVKSYKDERLRIFITWNTEYAAKLYYGDNYNFKQPGAKSYWGWELMHDKAKLQEIMQKSINLMYRKRNGK